MAVAYGLLIAMFLIILIKGSFTLVTYLYNASKQKHEQNKTLGYVHTLNGVIDYHREKYYVQNKSLELYEEGVKDISIPEQAAVIHCNNINSFIMCGPHYIWATKNHLHMYPTKTLIENYDYIEIDKWSVFSFSTDHLIAVKRNEELNLTEMILHFGETSSSLFFSRGDEETIQEVIYLSKHFVSS